MKRKSCACGCGRELSLAALQQGAQYFGNHANSCRANKYATIKKLVTYKKIPMCGCGCGNKVRTPYHKFILGHNTRLEHQKGERKGVMDRYHEYKRKHNEDIRARIPKLDVEHQKNIVNILPEKMLEISHLNIEQKELSPMKKQRRTSEEMLPKPCECGCGENAGYGKRFLVGHQFRTAAARQQKRELMNKRVAAGWRGVQHYTAESRRLLSVKNRARKVTWNTKAGYVCTPESRERYRVARQKKVFPFKDSKPELMMQTELLKRGYLYTKHAPLIGQPDILFSDVKLVVFVDGRFHHGDPREFSANDKQLDGKTMNDIWEKDASVNKQLTSNGYRVLRFWEKDIRTNIGACGDIVEMYLQSLHAEQIVPTVTGNDYMLMEVAYGTNP